MKIANRICVLGSINLDLIVKTQDLPQAGQTVGGGEFSVLPGGKGANVAVAAKRLGADVLLCGATGLDSYAEQALVTLEDIGVDLEQLIKLQDMATGVAFINVSKTGENQIAVASGANGAFRPEHIGDIQADALITQFEIPLETIEAALKSFEGFVCVNPSPVSEGLDRLLPFTDLIVVNEGEFAAYKDILENFSGKIVITLGERGAELKDGGKLVAKAMPPKVDVIDTTGAGDAFAAAITAAFVEGLTSQQALQFACAAGALTTTQLGTQTASPERAAVETALKGML